MKRAFVPGLLGTAALLVTLSACQDSPAVEAPVEEHAPAVTAESNETAQRQGALLDPNEATREELLAVPGVDETLADALIEGRPYQDMLEVDQVLAGQLSEAERETVYAHLWKPLDLNNATGEEILLIPGVGERMEHEFEEYRPYRAIEQFRREIGKYVDDEEVARLEQYVEVR